MIFRVIKKYKISVHVVKYNNGGGQTLPFTDLPVPNEAAVKSLSKVQVTDGAEDACHGSIIKLVYCHNVHVARHAT